MLDSGQSQVANDKRVRRELKAVQAIEINNKAELMQCHGQCMMNENKRRTGSNLHPVPVVHFFEVLNLESYFPRAWLYRLYRLTSLSL